MKPDLDEVYAILREWAAANRPQTYKDLSLAYQARTGDWFPYHGTWDAPLGEINQRLAAIDAPALSALVILQGKNEPGGGFWGCAPNVPYRPKNEAERTAAWSLILNEVTTYSWPPMLP